MMILQILSIIGNINPPDYLTKGYGEVGDTGGGLVGFLNNVIKFITIAAGLFAVINFILAGYGIMSSSGDPEKLSKAQNKIWFSIIGLILIVAAFTFATVIGWVVFHDPTIIISPKIYGPN